MSFVVPDRPLLVSPDGDRLFNDLARQVRELRDLLRTIATREAPTSVAERPLLQRPDDRAFNDLARQVRELRELVRNLSLYGPIGLVVYERPIVLSADGDRSFDDLSRQVRELRDFIRRVVEDV